MKGLIDPTAELNRLGKNFDKLKGQAEALAKKLSNEAFVSKAPAQVVEAEKEKLAANVHQKYLESYSPECFYRRHFKIYQSLVESKSNTKYHE